MRQNIKSLMNILRSARFFVVTVLLIASFLILSIGANAAGLSVFRSVSTFFGWQQPAAEVIAAQPVTQPATQLTPENSGDPVSDIVPQDGPVANAVTTSTYPFTSATGAALEDMSSGTTTINISDLDDGNSPGLNNIGFDFWYDGTRYTQFGAAANGYARLGSLPSAASPWVNETVFPSTTDAPKIAPFYDDLCIGTNGKVHFKTTGAAPNRKFILEYQNMQITRGSGCGAGAGTFQMWLYETTGKIEFVYGAGMTGSQDGGYTVGLQSGAATNFISVSTAGPSVSGAVSDNTQTDPIASGTKYTFTPNLPTAAPSGLTFTAVTGSGMTLNWTDNSSNELGFAIYRSTDGVNYTFAGQAAANTTSSAQSSLGAGMTYSWKVYAVTEGALGTALSGSQATVAGATYTWNQTGPAAFGTAANWTPTRTSPAASDILIFNNGANTTVTGVTTQTIGQLKISANTNVTLQAATSAKTLTISGGGGDDLDIAGGSTLQLSSATAVTLAFSGSNTGNIAGTLSLLGSATNIFNASNSVTTVSGAVNYTTGTITGSAATLQFASGGTFNNLGTTGAIPTASWNAASNVNVTGITTATSISGAGQTFGNFTWNCTGQTGNLNLSGTAVTAAGTFTMASTGSGTLRLAANTSGSLTAGNFIQTGGTLDLSSGSGSSTLRASGTFNHSAGTLTETGTGTSNTIEFNGSANQPVTPGTVSNTVSYRVNNSAGIAVTGTLAVTTGASMIISSAGTPVTSGGVSYTGTTTLVYNSATAAQTATATEFLSAGGPSNLTINNTAASPNNTVTLPFSRSIPGTLTLTAGLLNNGNNLLTVTGTTAASVSAGSATSYVNGQLARALPASLATGSTYGFPVGKGAFSKVELVNPTTNAGGTVTVQAEAFDADSGGTAGAGLGSLNTNRYWQAQITSGAGNFTNTSIRFTEPGVISANKIGGAATKTGIYDSIGGTVSGATILSNTITSLNFFAIGLGGFSGGTYTVGAGGAYTKIGDAIAAVNGGVIGGPVVLTLTDATYPSETFPLTINANPGSSATNTITIKPAPGASPAISGSVSSCIVKLSGADYVTIDGSNNGSNSRDLSIINNSGSNNSAAVCFSSLGAGAGATNNTIKNTVLRAGTLNNTSFGIVLAGTTNGANGADNDSNTIQNNDIAKAVYGILVSGTSASSAGGVDNLSIANNIVGPATAGAGNIGLQGIAIQNSIAPNLSGNTVRNVISSNSSVIGISIIDGVSNAVVTQSTITNISTSTEVPAAGISDGFAGTTNTGTQITGNTVSNVFATATSPSFSGAQGIVSGTPGARITGNTVSGISDAAAGGWPALGIEIDTGLPSSNITIANNAIYDIQSNSATATFATFAAPAGIYLQGNTGGINIYYNSVNLSGSHAGNSDPNNFQAALSVGPNITGLDVRNNIFSNSYDNPNAAPEKSYAIYSEAPTGSFTNINYNDYYGAGPNGVLGFINGADVASLTAWKTATGQDGNSIAANPLFLTPANLQMAAGSQALAAGTPIAGITTDITGAARSATIPSMGAYETGVTAPGYVQFNSASYTGAEGQTLTITVTREAGISGAIAVDYATGGGTATGGASCGTGVDYVNAAGTFSWADGDFSPKTFNVQLCTDQVTPEAAETVNLTLSNPSGTTIGGTNPAMIAINDTPIGVAAFSNHSAINIPLTGTASPYPSTITVSGMTGSIYNMKLTLNNLSHTYSSDMEMMLVGPQGQQFFFLSNAGANNPASNVNLQFYDSATNSLSAGPITSGSYKPTNLGVASFPPPPAPQTGPYFYAQPSGTDSFLSVFGGTDPNGVWSLYVYDIANPDGGSITGGWDLEVAAAETVHFNSANYTAAENGGTATITVDRTGAANAIAVDYATVGGTATGGASCGAGTDYVSTNGTLNFAAGETSKTFDVALCDDAIYDGVKTVNLTLSNVTGGITAILPPNPAVLTINDNDPPPTISIGDAAVNEAAGTISFTVTQSETSPVDTTFNYSTFDGTATGGIDYTTVSNSPATITAGATTANVTVPILQDAGYEGPEIFIVTISNAVNASVAAGKATGTINDDDTAATLVVNSLDDVNDTLCDAAHCSFREAFNKANLTGGVITFAANVRGTINLATNLSNVTHTMTINGPGADLLTINANNHGTVFTHQNNTIFLKISGLTITGGRNLTVNGGGFTNNGYLEISDSHITGNTGKEAGGIENFGTLSIKNSTLSNNTGVKTSVSCASNAGAIGSSGGFVSIANSTISGNAATGSCDNNYAGAILVFGGPVTITNSTITNNTSSSNSAAVAISSSTVSVRSTIIAGNAGNRDAQGSFSSGFYNLIGNGDSSSGFETVLDIKGTGASPFDPQLKPLAYYGGHTPTHAPLSSSNVFDTGNSFGQSLDQRGQPRPFDNGFPNQTGGDGSDSGAFEIQGQSTVIANGGPLNFADTNAGDVSAEQTYRIYAESIGSDLILTAPADFQISTTSGSGFGSTITLSPSAAVVETRTIYVRFAPQSGGAKNENISNASSGAATQNINVTGNGISVAPPSVNVTGGPLNFVDTPVNSISAEQTYIVSGSDLTADISISAPAQFQVSATSGSGFGSSVTLLRSGGAVANTTIYVRFAPTSAGLKSGDITNASTGATTQKVAVSGNGISAGRIRFSSSAYSDSETNADHIFNVAVSRNGGSFGAVSVDYAVTDGTATVADNDYSVTAATGTLNWADGDSAAKNIAITVKGDRTIEPDETVNLALSNVTGGAALGNPSSSVLTITNDDVPPTTYVVNVNDDTNDGACDAAHCSLREAINAINAAPGEIDFAPNVTGEIILLSPLPTLAPAYAAINGPGAGALTVKRDSSVTNVRIFAIAGGDVNISGLTIDHGAPDFGGGGGIYNFGDGTINITDCAFTNNVGGGSGRGGAVRHFGFGRMTITGSTFINNQADIGGAVSNDSYGAVTITNSNFSTSHANVGGTLSNESSQTMTLTNVVIDGSTSTFQAAGINVGFDGGLDITESRLSHCYAGNSGGAIYNTNAATVNITRSTISDNSATSVGGGIVNNTGTINIIASTISGNTVTSGNGAVGAGLYNNGTGTYNITNSTISGNNSSGSGGGLYLWNGNGPGHATITGSTITGNSARVGGGILPDTGIDITIKNTIVAGNTVSQYSPDIYGAVTSGGYNIIGNNQFATVIPATGDQIGTPGTPVNAMLGPLQNNGGPTLTHALLAGSAAIDAGNAFGLTTDQRGLTRPSDKVTIANVSDGSDIGAFELQAPPTPTISVDDVVFSADSRGSIAPNAFTVTLSNASDLTVTVHYQTADDSAHAGEDYTATSGTLTFAPGETTQTIPVSIVADNINEGAEQFFLNLDTPANATIADAQGAGIIPDDDPQVTFAIDDVTHMEGNSGSTAYTFTVTKTGMTAQTVSADYATINGSAVAPADFSAASGTLTFAPAETSKQITVFVNGDANFESNEIFYVRLTNPVAVDITRGEGIGTIQNDDAPQILKINVNADTDDGVCDATNCTLREAINAANAGGGQIDFAPNVTGSISLLTPLPALTNGDAIIINGPGANVLTVKRDSSAGGMRIFDINGSGVYTVGGLGINDGDVRPIGGAFNNLGGAIRIMASRGVTVNNCTFTNNRANNAAAIYNGANPATSPLTVNNSTFTANNANESGGGIYNRFGNTVTVNHSTFDANGAPNFGGGIYNKDTGVIFVNDSLFTGNAANSGAGIYNDDHGSITINRSSFTGNNAAVGAAVNNKDGGMDVFNSTLSGNTASEGGAAFNHFGTLNFFNSTLSGNTANSIGGAIYYTFQGASNGTISNCTITGNHGANGGGVTVFNGQSVVRMQNTILAGNTALTQGPDLFGTIYSSGYNILGTTGGSAANFVSTTGDQVGQFSTINPLLGALQDNGGPTKTHLPLPGSPAIDAGNAFGETADQRGFTRTVNSATDIGAVEIQNAPASISAFGGTPQSVFAGSNFAPLQARVLDAGSAPVGGVTVTFSAPNAGASGAFPGGVFSATAVTDGNGIATAPLFTANNTPGNFQVSAGYAAAPSATFDLTNLDRSTISVADVTFTGADSRGSGAPQGFTVTLSAAGAQTVTVHYQTADGTAVAGEDYTAAGDTLTFAPGETSKLIPVTILPDNVQEDTEQFYLNLDSASSNAVIADGQGIGTIPNEDAAPTFAIDDVTRAEGNSGTTAFTFTITKTGSTALGSTVNYTTNNGTAAAGSDYPATSGAVTFLPNENTKQVSVIVNGDTTFEPDETFTVDLTGASNGTFTDASGLGTITNDDTAPSFSIAHIELAEGNSGTTAFNFTVTKAGSTDLNASVHFETNDSSAQAPADFTAISGTLNFLPGDMSKTITVNVNGDTVFETNEAFSVRLSGPVNAGLTNDTGVGTIDNDDTAPSFSIDDVMHNEGNSGTTAYVFTVTKTGETGVTASVDFETQDGSATIADNDYQSNAGTLTFQAEETAKTITVLVNGNYLIEPDETFTVHLSNPNSAAISDAEGAGTITNDDNPPATAYVDDDWAALPDGTDPDGAGPALAIGYDSFDKIQEGIDAVADPGTVNVYSGAYNEDVLANKAGLQLLGAGAGTKTVSGPIGGSASTVAIAANNVTVAGFTITRDGNNTTDWNNPSLNNAGIAIQGQSITGAIIHDNILTGNRTAIDINNSNGHTVRNNVIDFNRVGLIFRNQTDNLTVVENFITNNWVIGVMFLDGSGGTNSPVQSAANSTFSNNSISGNWYAQTVDRQTGGSLPAPETTNLKNFKGNWFGTTVPVVTTANSAEPGYAAQIPVAYGGTATAPGGQPDIAGPASANFRYQPQLLDGTDTNIETTPGRGAFGFQGVPNVPIINIQDHTFTGVDSRGSGAAQGFTVTLTGDTNQTVTVHYQTSDGTALAGQDYTAASGTLTFDPGETIKTIPVNILPDNVQEPAENFSIDLDTPVNGAILGGHAVGTIPNDDAAPAFAVDNVTHNEGNTGTTAYTFTITRTGSTALNSTVNYTTQDGTATAPADYTAVSGSVVFGPADSAKTVTILVNGDIALENDETFILRLTGTDNGTVTGADGTGTIVNDDVPASIRFSAAAYMEDESQSAAIVITRTGDTTGATTVNFTTSNGSSPTATGGAACTLGVDYISTSAVVTFGPGDLTQTVNVPLCTDTYPELAENINLTLSGNTPPAVLGTQNTAVLTINDTASQYRSADPIAIGDSAIANPYPAILNVSGAPLTSGSVRLTLYDVSHNNPENMDVLLVSPTGQKMVVWGNAGGSNVLSNNTITFDDNSGKVLPNSNAITTGKYEPTNWVTPVAPFVSPAPPAPYIEPGSALDGFYLRNTFGAFNPNGNWTLYVRDRGSLGPLAPLAPLSSEAVGQIAGGWGLEFIAPTAASAEISGRVLTDDGRPISNVRVVLSGGALTESQSAYTGQLGYYNFSELPVGQNYVVTVKSRRFFFANPSHIFTLMDSLIDQDFIAEPRE